MKKLILFISVAFLCSYGFSQIANTAEIDEIRQAIKEKEAKWTAQENPVSRLPGDQRRQRLGAILSDGSEKGDSIKIESLPESFDWRDTDLITPVKDQGPCGSCWAFASVAQVEFFELLLASASAAGNPDGWRPPPPPTDFTDLSEQFLVSCERDNYGCKGGYLDRVYEYLKTTGTIDENCFPYAASDLSCRKKCKDWRNRIVKIDSYTIVAQDVDSLKAAISENPITVAFYVYTDFFYYESGVYEYTSGVLEGGHAVLAVGWDDDPDDAPGKGCFIVKNSWAVDWGESGYFRIAYTQMANQVVFGRDAGNFDKSTAPAPPYMGKPENLVTLWGKLKVAH